jgi:amidase
MAKHDELIRMTASEAVARLKAGEIQPLDLVEAAAVRIEAVEPAVNAGQPTSYGSPRGPA